MASVVPYSLAAPTRDGLTKLMLAVTAAQGGAPIEFFGFYWDGRNHICWYRPLRDPQ